jgi:hypothetical protein
VGRGRGVDRYNFSLLFLIANAKIKILSRIFCWDTEEVDVAIVGGGIAGLTLAKSGRGRG